MQKLMCLLLPLTLVTACTTVRSVDVLCQETAAPSDDLAALADEMPDSVALAAERLIAMLDAGCGK